jgi:hypothetical protein
LGQKQAYWSDFIEDSNNNVNQFSNTYFKTGLLSARPASPAAQDVYWATNDGANWAGTGSPRGVLYRAKTAGVWTQVYTPYDYPHPLQGGSGDFTAPVVTSSSINSAGTYITLTMSENVAVGAGGYGGLTLSASGGAVTTAISTLSGTTVVYGLSRVIQSGETVTRTYVQPGNGIEDTSGNDLASFSGIAVTNNSVVSADITAPVVTISTSSPQPISADSLSVSFTCTDAVGVTSRKWRVGAAPTATLGTSTTSPAATSGYSQGANTLYIGCGDAAGNWGSSSIVVNRDSVPAIIDNLSPSGILQCTTNPLNVNMTFTTNEAATGRYGLTDTVYGSLTSQFGATLVTSHSQSVSVPCGQSRTYYIRTSDALGNLNTSSTTISFSVASPQIAGPGGLRITGGRLTH